MGPCYGLISQLTRGKSRKVYLMGKVQKRGLSPMNQSKISISNIKVLGKMEKWKVSVSCWCHKVRYILESSLMVIHKGMELGDGSTEISTKVRSKMAISKAKEPFSAKKVVGLLQASGNKVKWVVKALVNGKIALSIRVSGETVLKRVQGPWATLMARFTQGISRVITRTDKVKRTLLMEVYS